MIPAADPAGARFARRVAEIAARLTYRSVEVVTVGEPAHGPTVLVSNHFGGLADALLLLYVSPRFPRIVARDVIWHFPIAGRFMPWIGAIPVSRRADSTDASATRNDDMFAACYQALHDGAVVLIFPEGVTQDVPHLAPVKTGASRIALGAVQQGVTGVRVQPVGIHYEDKAAFRSRVLIAFGAPVDVAPFATGLSPDEPDDARQHEAVTALTTRVDRALRASAPNFGDWDEVDDLHLAAEATLRSLDGQGLPTDPVPLSLREPLAAALAALPSAPLASIRAAAADYRQTLQALGSTDAELAQPRPRGAASGRVVLSVLTTVLLLPYALVGALLAALPYLLVQSTRLLRAAPAMRATLMPAVALVVFVTEWVVLAMLAGRDGWQAGVLVALLVPAFLGAAVFVAEQLVVTWRAVRRWATRHRRASPVLRSLSLRDALVTSVSTGLREVRR